MSQPGHHMLPVHTGTVLSTTVSCYTALVFTHTLSHVHRPRRGSPTGRPRPSIGSRLGRVELSRQNANFGSTSLHWCARQRTADHRRRRHKYLAASWCSVAIASIHLVGQAKPTAEEEAVLGHPDEVARHMRISESGGPSYSLHSTAVEVCHMLVAGGATHVGGLHGDKSRR